MRYEEKPQITEQEIREAMDFSTAQVKRNLPEFHDEVPEGLQRERVLRADGQCGLDDGILDGRDLAVLRGYRERHL